MNPCNPCGTTGTAAAGGRGDDGFEAGPATRHFDRSATAWLIGQAIAHFNRDDDEGALVWQRTTELLAAREDAVATLVELHHRVPDGDVGLRWNLLHLMGRVGDAASAAFLADAALQPLPAHDRKAGCEGPRDAELLLRTMAVEALAAVAERHPEAAGRVAAIVAARPAQPVLVEAVKAAVALGWADKVRDLLPEDQRWMLGIRKVRHEELSADVARHDGGETGNRVPRLRAEHTAPDSRCGCR